MTVASETSDVSYACDGSTQVFSIPFYFLKDADIVVVLRDADGNEVTKMLTTDYTLSGAADEDGGSCTTLAAYASGNTLLIYRDPAAVQNTDYVPNDDFPAASHEQALDLLTMLIQRTRQLIAKAIVLPITSTLSNIKLPEPGAGKFLRWNSGGTALEAVDVAGLGAAGQATESESGIAKVATQTVTNTGTDDATFITPKKLAGQLASNSVTDTGTSTSTMVTPAGLTHWFQTGLNFLQAGTGAAARAIRDKMREHVSVDDFGAKGDGTTDDSVAIQAAIDSLTSKGGVIEFSADKDYAFGTKLNLASLVGVTLRGQAGRSAGAQLSSRLLFTGTGTGDAIDLTSTTGCAIENLQINWSKSGFTGTVIDALGTTLAPTNMLRLHRVSIGPNFTGEAATHLLNIDKAETVACSECHFSGADYSVIGGDSTSFSNVVTFRDCEFAEARTAAVRNPCQSWTFDGCAFEPGNGTTTDQPSGIYSDTNSSVEALTVRGCWFGDAEADGTWIRLQNVKGANVSGNFISGNGSGGASIDGIECVSGVDGLAIHGNRFYNCGAAGIAFDASTAGVSCKGNYFSGNAADVVGIASASGDFTSNSPDIANHSLAENGWRINPDGTIEQWGKLTSLSTTETITTFTKAYSSWVNLQVTTDTPGGTGDMVYAADIGLTSFGATTMAGTANARWRAIGV